MANLLDPIIKQNIKREYRLRVSAILMFLLALCVLAATVLLIPAYLNSESELRTIGYEIEALQNAGTSVIDPETQAAAAAAGARIKILKNETVDGVAQYIEYVSVLSALPDNVDYVSISFSRDVINSDDQTGNAETVSRVLVSGTAPDRETFFNALQNIQAIDWVEDVEYPLSSLSQRQQIDFSLQITYQSDKIESLQTYYQQILLPPDEDSDLPILDGAGSINQQFDEFLEVNPREVSDTNNSTNNNSAESENTTLPILINADDIN